MARVTVEDCLGHVENRFELVLASARRARQLYNGVDPLVAWENDKPTVVALREIAEGQVTSEILASAEEEASESAQLGGFSAADVEAEVGGGPPQPDPNASEERAFGADEGDPNVGLSGEQGGSYGEADGSGEDEGHDPLP